MQTCSSTGEFLPEYKKMGVYPTMGILLELGGVLLSKNSENFILEKSPVLPLESGEVLSLENQQEFLMDG